MSETTTTTAAGSTRRTNGWRTSTLVLLLLCIAMGVGWFMRDRQLRMDYDQERQNFDVQLKMLQRELDSRPLPPDEGDQQPGTRPTTRPVAQQPS